MNHHFLIAAYVVVFVLQIGYLLRVLLGLAKTPR
jgi:hypothetical protein